MTENKRFRMEIIEGASLPFIVDNDSAKKRGNKITSYHIYETHGREKCLELVDLLNALHEENESLKKHITELYDMVKFDVDNGIEVYPKILMECFLNILKILGDD